MLCSTQRFLMFVMHYNLHKNAKICMKNISSESETQIRSSRILDTKHHTVFTKIIILPKYLPRIFNYTSREWMKREQGKVPRVAITSFKIVNPGRPVMGRFNSLKYIEPYQCEDSITLNEVTHVWTLLLVYSAVPTSRYLLVYTLK